MTDFKTLLQTELKLKNFALLDELNHLKKVWKLQHAIFKVHGQNITNLKSQ